MDYAGWQTSHTFDNIMENSQWDTTEMQSTTFSDGSTIVPDYYGLRLRRAIDQKVRKLRTLLTADTDITTELDRVVCRLMKLALCTSRGKQNPPPISWMQCKLFDLLTLTEKSIERRRLQICSLKAIEYQKGYRHHDATMPRSITLAQRELADFTLLSEHYGELSGTEIISHNEIRMDSSGDLILSKYQNLDLPPDYMAYTNGDSQVYDYSEFEDYNISITSNEFKDEFLERNDDNIREEELDLKKLNIHDMDLPVEDTGQLSNCNLNLVQYPSLVSSAESSCSTSNGAGIKQEKFEDQNEISLHKICAINSSGSNKSVNKKFPKKRSKSSFESKLNIHKASRTKINKKVSSRRSSYINNRKLDSLKYNKKYTFKERNMPKEHQMSHSTPSRPIPASLIELCHSLSNKNLNKKATISNSKQGELCQLNSETDAEKFIEIVAEDYEETITMRRNARISHESEFDILEKEHVQNVITLSKDNSFCKPKIETENVQSQAIFLYDLNEPSTSKGVRHLCTDVQCGPDVTTASPMMSETTSYTRMPKFYTTGIRIGEPRTDIKINKITSDFGTCTEICGNALSVGKKSAGIKIKESSPDVSETFKMTQVIDDNVTSVQLTNFDSRTETQLLKPVSSALKTEDSGSEFCMSVGSYAKSPTRLAVLSKNISDFQIQSASNERNVVVKISQASHDKMNLVYGGVHVHSFNERKVSEDVVYQGEWQRKQQLPKKNYSTFARKSLQIPKRQKLHPKEHSREDDIKRVSKKNVSVTHHKSTVKNLEPFNKIAQNKVKYSTHIDKTDKNNTDRKVPSKAGLSLHVSKNMKTIYTTKKRTSVNTLETPIKKEDEQKNNRQLHNYLPLYLRKRMKSSGIKSNTIENKSKNEINLKSEKIILKSKVLSSLKTQDVTKDLINITEKTLLTNINHEYMIFHNQIQSENNSTTKLPAAKGIVKNDNLDCTHSPPSQHSSTCSSPNSVATVRAVSTRNRVTSNRRNSTSSERSSSGMLESEHKTPKNKKFSRRTKSTKKPLILSSILHDNKENVPESSKNTISPIKDKEKSAKGVFLGRTKSVFMAQMTTEASTLPSTTISKTKMQSLTKSLKLANINTRSIIDQSNEPSRSSISSINESTEDKDINNYCSTRVTEDKAIIPETFTEPCSNNLSENDNCTNSNETDDECLNSGQSVHSTKSSIISAIRKLIENKLNIPENYYNRSDSDSETVILSRDDDYGNDNRFKNNISPNSIGEANTNDITQESGRDVYNSHIYHPSTINENEMVPKDLDSNSKLLANEFDAQSLKSFASMSTSKLSEYYLADNEFETAVPQVDTLNVSSIQDIFERKELNTIPNVGGVLAIQAFSGFSMNEPLTGDQPDFVNFIDSETGSFAFESARQAASEEIFVSGRSSDTYESCYVEEDTYVPNWLFNMISQQQSASESEAEEVSLPSQMPMEEPDFDMNDNVMEPEIGVGAGAGDGRGIHSDNSQDSSGRGTSLSSSETSSGPQSEAILIHPSNFTAQVEYLREPMNLSAPIGASHRPDVSTVSNAGENHADSSNHQSWSPRCLINPMQVASDIDADVSSLETDAVDSDN